MMNKQRTLRRVGLVAGSSLLALAAIGPAASPAFAKPSGSIWTTSDSCSAASPQNDNSYASGETVHVRGANFAADSGFTWVITGKPGGASGDPNQDVTNGNGTTDAAGGFCVVAYIVEADDWGEYSVNVEQGSTKKNDNYSVEQMVVEEPGDEGDEPGDEDTTPPSDEDTTPPSDEESTLPSDEDTTPPADEDTTPPADEDDSNDGSDPTYSQEVLGVVSGGPTVTPPPTDMIVAPSDQGSGIDWRVIVAFLGVLILAATIGLPERRRRA